MKTLGGQVRCIMGNMEVACRTFWHDVTAAVTIIPRARMGSESIAHEAEGRMGY